MHVTIQDVLQECSVLENHMLGLPTEQAKGKKANGQHSYMKKWCNPHV